MDIYIERERERERQRLLAPGVAVLPWATETVLSPWLAADEARVSHVLSHVVWWKKNKKKQHIYIYIYIARERDRQTEKERERGRFAVMYYFQTIYLIVYFQNPTFNKVKNCFIINFKMMSKE